MRKVTIELLLVFVVVEQSNLEASFMVVVLRHITVLNNIPHHDQVVSQIRRQQSFLVVHFQEGGLVLRVEDLIPETNNVALGVIPEVVG